MGRDKSSFKAAELRAYRFKAKITGNDGVTPFKVGGLITGSLKYDLNGENISPKKTTHAQYRSVRNTFSFEVGDLRFTGAGDVWVTIGAFPHAEHFQIVAFDLNLPRGWQMDHTKRSQTYAIVLQNAPAKKVITSLKIPDRITLAAFTSTRELRLDFFHGVTFPGGRVKGRAIVHATVESLEVEKGR
jgi:hypothetical protein